ncbi:MAG TPA: DUF3006 domain-containing protein [Gemmatimonadaceae bacterium]|nr:DUF3006 domain-containing protein [Gemmatimonadaceae bacterium]
MLWIIDRFEGSIAVIEREDGLTLDLPREWLPRQAAEGAVVRLSATRAGESSTVEFQLDPEATARRRAELERLRDAIPKAPDGDIAL